jgi:5-dehydro-2-deoxygluconokinase
VIRQALPLVNVAIGTEEEVKAAAGASRVSIAHSQVSSPEVEGDIANATRRLMDSELVALVVKRGACGATVYTDDHAVIEAAPFPVEVLNLLGAGDAFACGFLYGSLRDRNWQRAARMGNAVGAIVVTRPACANSMPTLAEVKAFVDARGGL